MYKLLYKMHYHLMKNMFLKVLGVRILLSLYFLKRYHFKD